MMRKNWGLESVRHRQEVFCLALKKQFMTKIVKYQNILLRNGIYFNDDSNNVSIEQEAAIFQDDNIIVLGHDSFSFKNNLMKQFSRCGNNTSLRKVSHLVYALIARRKAGRICMHLDGVTDVDIKSSIEAVAREMVVAYEYQLMMLYSDWEVVRLAEHAVACMLSYLEDKDAEFSCEALLTAVLEVKPKNSNKKEILRTREFVYKDFILCPRWKVGRILKEPGLRVGNICKKHDSRTVNFSTDTPSEIPALDFFSPVNPEDNNSNSTVEVGADLRMPATAQESYKDNDDNGDYTDNDWSSISESSTDPTETVAVYDETETTELTSTNQECLLIGLEDVSAALSGQLTSGFVDADTVKYTSPENSFHRLRRLSSAELDFENNSLHIHEYTCSVEKFSPLNSMSEGTDNTASGDGEDHTDAEDEMSAKDDSPDSGPNVAEFVLGSVHNSRRMKGKMIASPEEVGLNSMMDGRGRMRSVAGGFVDRLRSDSDSNVSYRSDTSEREYHEIASAYDLPGRTFNTSLVSEHSSSRGHVVMPSKGSEQAKANGFRYYGCFTPFGAKCQPRVYGFRGPLHIWNKDKAAFTYIYNDMVSIESDVCREIAFNPQSVHMSYVPFTCCSHQIPIV